MPSSRFRFYTTSEKAWSAMLSAISLAQESIFLEMYIFAEDTKGYDFISELERKAKEGVKVILILDGLGSAGLGDAIADRLRIAGAEVLFFSNWRKRLHRKVLIVDAYTVFLGGVNISRQFAPWRDLQVRLSGKQFAKNALVSFQRVYLLLGGTDPIFKKEPAVKNFHRMKLWFIEHGMHSKRNKLREYYEKHIAGATAHIILITPYFVPRPWLINRLRDALKRGVKVEIIIPKHTDYMLVDRVNYHFLSLLRGFGAECVLTPKMNHAKAMVIDSKEAIIGSHNLDSLSFEHNVEGGVFFEDEQMIAQLMLIIAEWKKDGETPEESIRFHWYDSVLSFFLPFFESVL